MNGTALWIILLGIWVFVLQSRIKHLETVVATLLKKQRTAADAVPQMNEEREEYVESESEREEVRQLDTEEGAVASFKAAHGGEETLEVSMTQGPKQERPSWWMSMLTGYFSGGNLLVRIGGVILFFGLAFLAKYAAEHSMVSMQMRLWGIASLGALLVALGWKLRRKEDAYGQILQGLGVAVLYLVIYSAAKFYAMLSLDTAFGLMLGVVVIGSALSVIEDALPLALFATVGGFLTPILASGGEGSHIVLFGYYAFLNLGIFLVAWYRSWRLLNVVGFLFTFVIATVWGVLRYEGSLFATVEPFLLLYFAMYLAIAILFTRKHPFSPKNYVDSTLVFGLPLVAFPLQLHLVSPFAYGDAWSAGVLGLLYLGLWRWLRTKERTALLAQSFLVLGVLFITITIPYLFDADVTGAFWSVEGTAAIWLGIKQSRRLTQYFGGVLLAVGALIYADGVGGYPLAFAEALGYLMVIGALGTAAYLWQKRSDADDPNKWIIGFYWLMALLLWMTVSLDLIERVGIFSMGSIPVAGMLAGAVVLVAVTRKVVWRLPVMTLQWLLPLSWGVMLLQISETLGAYHLFQKTDWALWISVWLLHYAMLRLYDRQWSWARPLHLLGLWFGVFVASTEIHYHLLEFSSAQVRHLSWMIVPVAVVVMLFYRRSSPAWLTPYRTLYQYTGAGVLAGIMLLWEWRGFAIVSDTAIPLFNLIDMGQTIIFGLILYWVYRHRDRWSGELAAVVYSVVGITALVLLSTVFARWVHHTQHIAYTLPVLGHSLYFQTGLSILWSLAAIVVMLLSKRYALRPLWMAGFGLLLAVVAKLFVVELAGSGTIERIVSFMVVGVLLLLIGYFVPLPPQREGDEV